MENLKLIEAWKKSDFCVSEKPTINEDLLRQINGGGGSAGYVCTVSAECGGLFRAGSSCGDLVGVGIEFVRSVAFFLF